ncbi:GTP-binding protein Rho1 [Serendipita sp. 399]|nr:GTP-binding protein Rho1 [Serendipita sp. 399]
MFPSHKPKRIEPLSKKLFITGDYYSVELVVDNAMLGLELFRRYHTRKYPEIYITWLESVQVNIAVFSRLVQLDLWQIRPPEDGLRALYYVNTSIIIVCFAIDVPSSLDDVENFWIDEIKRFTTTRDGWTPPIILVGNRKEVRLEWELGTEKLVSVEQGQEMAKRIGAAIYLECSSRTGEGVDDVFHHAARLCLR